MLPNTNSPPFIHPPMLPPASEDAGMEYLQSNVGNAQDDVADALFSTYLHPPMQLPESPNQQMQQLQQQQGVHPPMLPPDWNSNNHNEFFNESGIQAAY